MTEFVPTYVTATPFSFNTFQRSSIRTSKGEITNTKNGDTH